MPIGAPARGALYRLVVNRFSLVTAVAVALIAAAASSTSAQASSWTVEGAENVSVSNGGSTVTYSDSLASSPSTLEFNLQVPFKQGRFDQQITVGRVVLCRVESFKLTEGANTVKCRLRQAAIKRIRLKLGGSVKAALKMTITNDVEQAITFRTPVTVRLLQ